MAAPASRAATICASRSRRWARYPARRRRVVDQVAVAGGDAAQAEPAAAQALEGGQVGGHVAGGRSDRRTVDPSIDRVAREQHALLLQQVAEVVGAVPGVCMACSRNSVASSSKPSSISTSGRRRPATSAPVRAASGGGAPGVVVVGVGDERSTGCGRHRSRRWRRRGRRSPGPGSIDRDLVDADQVGVGAGAGHGAGVGGDDAADQRADGRGHARRQVRHRTAAP